MGRDPLKLPGPRLSPRRELGIPWRRPSALSLLGRDPGKPWYPRRDGESAFSFLTHLLADKLVLSAAGEMRFPAFAFNLSLL